MFDINGTLVIFVASFLIYLVLLNEIMLKPVGKVISERAERISRDLEAAKQSRLTAAELVAKYESDVKRIRSQSQDLIAQAVEESNRNKADELATVQIEANEKLVQAKQEIAAERSALIDELVVHERELVAEITRKVLGEPVSVEIDEMKVRKTLEEAC